MCLQPPSKPLDAILMIKLKFKYAEPRDLRDRKIHDTEYQYPEPSETTFIPGLQSLEPISCLFFFFFGTT